MDFFWFFFNNANCNDQKLSDKDISFECSSPAYRMSPSTTAVNEDTPPQPQLASVDIFLKYDSHNLSRQLIYFLGIKIIPKLPTYQFISENGLVSLSQIRHAYSPQVAHPLSYIIFDCRFPSSIPGPLSSILSKFFDGFVRFNHCSKDIQNQFNSRKSVLWLLRGV